MPSKSMYTDIVASGNVYIIIDYKPYLALIVNNNYYMCIYIINEIKIKLFWTVN